MSEPYDIDFSQFGILQRKESWLYRQSREVIFPADFAYARAVCARLEQIITAIKSQYAFSRGCGVAAPQIGELARITAIIMPDEPVPHFFINPQIIEQSAQQVLDYEGCLSFWEWRGRVWRPEKITVAYLDFNGSSHSLAMTGNLARLMCHEIDHFDGILYNTRMPESESLMDLSQYQSLRTTGELPPPQFLSPTRA